MINDKECPFKIGDWVCLKGDCPQEQPTFTILDIQRFTGCTDWQITVSTGSQIFNCSHIELRHWYQGEYLTSTPKKQIYPGIAEDLWNLHGIDVKPNPFIPPGEIVVTSGGKEVAKITNIEEEEKEIRITRCVDLLIEEI